MNTMNRDVLMGKWRQLRGTVRKQWGKLTHNQIRQLGGEYDRLVGTLQESYGHMRHQAVRRVDDWNHNMKRGAKDTRGKH